VQPNFSVTDRSWPTARDARGRVKHHHPDGAFAQFREYLLARDMGSILFQKEPSDKPGTIQSVNDLFVEGFVGTFQVRNFQRAHCLNRSL
jgi:hypothetical protein